MASCSRNLERKDLDFVCPRGIRDKIAGEIIDEWYSVGRALDVSDTKLKSIRRDNSTPEEKAIAVLDAWAEEHGSVATCLKLEEALKRHKKTGVREILYKEIIRFKNIETTSGAFVAVPPQLSDKQQQEQGHDIIEHDVEVFTRIKELDSHFRLLHTKIESELELKKVTVRKLLRSLSVLPYDIEQEYKQTITEKLQDLRKEEEVADIFCFYINPLVSFMDYGLTKHIIDQFGSNTLKKEMNDYSEDVVQFMKKTTVKKMMDHWPGRQEIPSNYSTLIVTINDDPKMYTLYDVDQLRKRYCSELKMSTLTFKTIGLKMSNSFIVEWLVSSALVQQLMESARQIDFGFYFRERMLKVAVMVGEKQIFPFLPDSKPKVSAALQTTAAMVTEEQVQEAEQHAVAREMTAEVRVQAAQEQLEKEAEVKVQEAQEQADQEEQRAIALVKKNAELERRLHEMEERVRGSKRRTNVIELKDNPSSDSVEEKPLALVPVKTEVKEEPVTVTKDETTSAQPTAAWDLRGVEVCGEMTVVVHSSGAQQITWQGFGLKLHIEEGSLPAGIHQCILTIKASLAGQYKFPHNSYLVSAIFWLRCESMCKFTKPVTVEMQHCARSENVANLKLKFVRAVCSQKQLPYTFKELGGDFTRHSSYGVVEVNGFSGLAITQEGSEEREYCSQLFYLGQPNSCRVHFVVIWNIEAHLTVVKEEYERERAIRGLYQLVDFESDTITLDIPLDGLSIKGWTITPLIPPVVTRKQVDNFREGKLTPCCQLKAEVSRKSKKVSTLKHRVTMNGAKPPNNVFVIDLPAEDPYSHVRFQTFRDLAAAAGPPAKKRRRLEELNPLQLTASTNTSTIPYSMESDVLQSHYASLNLAISDNLDVFGSYLVQYGFAPQTTVTGIVSTLGVNNYQKATKLLEIVDSRFKTSSPGQSAKTFFDDFVLILVNKLKQSDIAQSLVAIYKSKDPTYVSLLEETATSSSAGHQPGRDH